MALNRNGKMLMKYTIEMERCQWDRGSITIKLVGKIQGPQAKKPLNKVGGIYVDCGDISLAKMLK